MKKLIAAVALAAVVGSSAVAQQQKAPAATTTFATKVAASNAFEIRSSQLAAGRAEREEVKTFATQMIADHTKAGEDFKAAVQAANLTPPAEALNAKQKSEIDRLQNSRGRSFDQAYATAQRQAHEEAVALFRNYVQSGPAGPLKDFAQKTLPTLEHHLTMISEVSRQIATSQARRPATDTKTKTAQDSKTAQREAAREPRSRLAQKGAERNGAAPARRSATKAAKKKRYARRHKVRKAHASLRRKHARQHRHRVAMHYRHSDHRMCCPCWCCSRW